MAQIITYPDMRLTQKSEPVLSFGRDVERIAERLEKVLVRTCAMGLSAPQLGFNRRIIAVASKDSGPVVLVNPEISRAQGFKVEEEGCLSLPGVYLRIPRPQRVVATGCDIYGNEMKIHAKGFSARAFVHEVDHLDGILIWDRLPFGPRTASMKSFADLSLKTR